ncbi:MAG: LPS export ABC transporter permease LptF [Alphaproteobacteria bacterium]
MKIVSTYFIRLIAINTAIITFSLTGAIWLTQSLRFVDLIMNKGLSIVIFLKLVIFLIPRFLVVILPIGAFAGVMSAYCKLGSDSEIVALKGAGFNKISLAKPAIYFAMIMMMLGYAFNLYILPKSFTAFKELQFAITNNYGTFLLQEGVFNNLQKNLTVYIRSRSSDGDLQGVLIHDNRKQDAPATILAKKGYLQATEQGPSVVMVEGSRQERDNETGLMTILYFESYTINLGQLSQNFSPQWKSAKERTIFELFSPGNSAMSIQNREKLRIEGHSRLIEPFYNLTLPLIGLAFLLNGAFSRRGQSRTVIYAVITVITIKLLDIGLGNLAVKNAFLIPLMYLNAFVVTGLGFLCLYKDPHPFLALVSNKIKQLYRKISKKS